MYASSPTQLLDNGGEGAVDGQGQRWRQAISQLS